MKKIRTSIDKDKTKSLILAIVLAVAFVVGIPLIILGAKNALWFVMTIGIIFVVFGFYGTPMAFVHFSNVVGIKRVVDAVLIEGINNVTSISRQLQISPQVAKQRVTTAIQKRYIMGYIFDGENLLETQPKQNKKKAISNHCPNCGGKMESFDGYDFCPYCNTRFKFED